MKVFRTDVKWFTYTPEANGNNNDGAPPIYVTYKLKFLEPRQSDDHDGAPSAHTTQMRTFQN